MPGAKRPPAFPGHWLDRYLMEFLHTPSSPAFNPAEYLIHLVRQDALYHLPCTFTLQDKADRVQARLAQGPPLTPEQMRSVGRRSLGARQVAQFRAQMRAVAKPRQ